MSISDRLGRLVYIVMVTGVVSALSPIPSAAEGDNLICHEFTIDDEHLYMGCFSYGFGSSSSSSLLETTSSSLLITTTTTTTTTTTSTSTTSTTSTTIPFAEQSCADPIPDASSAGPAALTTASDALFVLNAAVSLRNCRDCICDVNGSGLITSTDALITLNIAVGIDLPLMCPPCSAPRRLTPAA